MADQKPSTQPGQCSEKCDPNCKDANKQGCCATGTCTKDQHQCTDKCASSGNCTRNPHQCSDKCATDKAACEQKKNLPGRTRMSPEELEEARKREEARKAGNQQ